MPKGASRVRAVPNQAHRSEITGRKCIRAKLNLALLQRPRWFADIAVGLTKTRHKGMSYCNGERVRAGTRLSSIGDEGHGEANACW